MGICEKVLVVQLVGRSPLSEKVVGLNLVLGSSWGFGMFSPCMHGLALGYSGFLPQPKKHGC